MNIHIACGGTGGHIFPGLATADLLQTRGHNVTLWLAGKDVEAKAVEGWRGRVITVRAEGLPAGVSLGALRGAWTLLRAAAACLSAMRRDRPDVLLAMGSYASVGPALAAILLRVPFVLHESNVVPGRAISLLSRWAAAVACCFEETRFHLRGRRVVLTGMPMRRALVQAAAGRDADTRAPGAPLTLLITGGSRGAHALNTVAAEAVCRAAAAQPLRVIHLTGPRDEADVRRRYQAAAVGHEVQAFAHDMERIYAAADLAVCRSGAATCAELSAFAVPSLLVPYPHAVRDHQMANARAMERLGAADVVPEPGLTEDWLTGYLGEALRDRDRLDRMRGALRARAADTAAAALADLVERMGGSPRV